MQVYDTQPSTVLCVQYMHQSSTTDLNTSLLLLRSLSLGFLLSLALSLPLQLVRTTDSDILRTEVTEQLLEHILNQPATSVVEDHENSQSDLELVAEGNQAQLLVDLGNELGGTRESNTGCGNKTPVHGLVLADGLPERTALVVDREGRDLLDQLEQVDGAVKQRGLELALEVYIVASPRWDVSKMPRVIMRYQIRTAQSCRRSWTGRSG